MADVTFQLGSGDQDPSYQNVDRISGLPWEILNIILGKLSIVDAVWTSVLAEEWRYKWLSLSNFSLDDFTDIFDEVGGCEIFEMNHGWDVVIGATNSYLLHHTSSIRSFSLKIDDCFDHYPLIYQWLHYLSTQDLEALSFKVVGPWLFLMPSYLLSFQKLKSLHLRTCALEIPAAFEGFRLLNELYLRDVWISDADLSHLILSCPLLENLTLLSIYELRHLRINAPGLSRLFVDISYEDIVIEAAPNLSTVRIYSSRILEAERIFNMQSVINCLSGIGSLNHLDLSGYFIMLLAADDGFKNFPLYNDAVTSLNLYNLRINGIEEIRVCLSLLKSFRNIKCFSFLIKSLKGGKLIKKFYKKNRGQFFFTKLESITVVCPSYAGMGSAVNLIQFYY